MNCQRCNTNIDYRFLTNCTQCNCEVEGSSLPQAVTDPSPVNSGEKAYTWQARIVNLLYLVAASVAGMISGAVVIYFSAVIAYLVLDSGGGTPGERCARGTAIAMLSILSGAFMGTVGGTVFAVKNPICKRPA
jgi:hypothetical protein